MFPQLKFGMRVRLKFAPDVIVAMVVVYNFLRLRRTDDEDDEDDDDDDHREDEPDPHVEEGGAGPADRGAVRAEAVRKRDYLKDQFCSVPTGQ